MATPQDSLLVEQALLGALIIQGDLLAGVMPMVSPDSFSAPGHRLIYQAMLDLHQGGAPVDLVTVSQAIIDRQQLMQVGGILYLAELPAKAALARNAPYYALEVRSKAQLRDLEDRCHSIAKLCREANGNARDVLLHAESLIFEITSREDVTETQIIPEDELLSRDYSKEHYLIANGILPAGGGLILAGESGEGKSLLRMELAVHLALGRDCWNLDIPKPIRVLTLQFENTEKIEQFRLKRMLSGLQANACGGHLLFPDAPVRFDLGERSDQVRLINLIEKSRAELVIYDPLTSLHRINENDNVQMRAVLDTVTEINRQTGAAAMVIHHYGKPDKDGTNTSHRTRGASSIRDWCDTLLGLSRKKGEAILRTLEFIKVRNGPEPAAVTLERSKETFLHKLIEDDDICPPGKVRAILEAMGGEVEGQEALKTAIMDEVGCADRRARHFIQQAINQYAIRKEDHVSDSRKKIYRITGTKI